MNEPKKKGHLRVLEGKNDPIVFPAMIDTGNGGKRPAKDHMLNTKAVMDHYGFSVRYNRMTANMELSRHGELVAEGQNRARAMLENRCAEHQLSRAAVDPHLMNLAEPYHPVEDWLDAEIGGWDGQDRYPAVFDTIELRRGYRHRDLASGLLRTWCRLAAAMATAGASVPTAQGALVLQGAQGAGKTRWLATLAAQPGFFLSGVHLDPNDKDSVAVARSRWIVELGEIDGTFRKSDIAALKAYITKDADTYRVPYGRTPETLIRRTAYCASVNPQHFLVDETGNRRWWTVPIDHCDVDALRRVDIRQFWLQMRQEVRQGALTWLDDSLAAQLVEANLEHEAQDPLVAALAAAYEPDPLRTQPHTVAQFIAEIDMLSKVPADRKLSLRIGRAMADIGAECSKVGGTRVWYVTRAAGRF
jgi:putative DNA primase/helicase